ncbi:hypothetical protein N566_27990 [Streptomycetaceae bacterium MP113-05]|nr:hypothetical protein N566_27990 [Streptomycetaceae bacterium MP113-05]
MAFSADELRVLRGALAVALQSSRASAWEVREILQLAESLDEAEREEHRLRSFLLADLARYRAALPGSATGYLEQLEDALAVGYLPRVDDLAALQSLAEQPVGLPESDRRAELLGRCERLAEQAVRGRLLVLPGGRSVTTGAGPQSAEEKPEGDPQKEPKKEPRREPGKPSPQPGRRPVPTPGEVFPPRRRPAVPPEDALSA